ncbi:BTB/POZ protein [Glomus cerebriforme]|uniref:BTB/POZ protein n=1 Tax=Glomus cerebriforme TaxID=658196 RepID=A0A397ST04_9GLOM|nr:BTB/POZ protein [Glomus cerebriforme]
MSANYNQRIVLNIGGIKYETIKSTLIMYPDTLLGIMFSESNGILVHPTNGNEYFIDRNGYAFRYVLEYYRTGKVLWTDNTTITLQELIAEFDYFKIPHNLEKENRLIQKNQKNHNLATVDEFAATLDAFYDAIKVIIYEAYRNYRETVSLGFYPSTRDWYRVARTYLMYVDPDIDSIVNVLKPFNASGYKLLKDFRENIIRKLKEEFPGLKVNGGSNIFYSYLKITIKITTPAQSILQRSKLNN